jgi:hypothetical protein
MRCRHVRPTFALAAAVLLWCCAATAEAQLFRGLGLELEPLVEPKFELIDNASRSHLDRVDQFLADGQQDEAIEILRRAMETDGDKLLRVAEYKDDRKTAYVRYYPVRHSVHLRLANMARTAPDALALYRSRVDRIAERWLKQGVAERDPKQVERVVRDYFTSTFGDDALWQLGEFALERGDYAGAREAWERLSPLTRTPALVDERWAVPPGRPLWLALRGVKLDERWERIEPALTSAPAAQNWLAYPDTNIPLADIRARLALVSIVEGNRARATIELELLRRLHADATGRIGGRTGRYVDVLGSLLEQSAAWSSAADPQGWPTFAGALSRNGVAKRELKPAAKELWHVDLPLITSDREAIGAGRPRVAEDHRGLLSYHPVVWRDLVIVPEHTQIRALKLSDGSPAWPGGSGDGVIYRPVINADREEEREYPIGQPHPRSRAYVGAARFTATVHGQQLFARMGSRLTVSLEENPTGTDRQGVIVGLDLAAQGRMLRGFPLVPESLEWNFEGTPVTDGVGLYVALRKHDQVNAQAHVACYDVATGELRWRRLVCYASTPGHGSRDEISHGLLTLVDGALYYNTNLGAVAKLSTETGAIAWAVQYPRGAFPSQDPDRRDRHFFRDLTPCVYYRGMVIAAPSDCEAIFALDAATGQTVWATPPEIGSDAVHLLGAAGDRLIASGDYLYWFDVFNGQPAGQFPPPRKDAPGFGLPSPTGFGRGVLAGEQVYWPTRERILAFEQQTTGTARGYEPVATEPIDLVTREARGGNIIPAGDKLLVVGAKKLQVFDNP